MYCQSCGKPYTPNANFCSVCGAAVVSQPPVYPARPILRPRTPRVIAGVCSGFAQHFGWDLSLVRILLCVFTFLTGGTGVLVYIACWVILPEAAFELPAAVAYPNTPGTAV